MNSLQTLGASAVTFLNQPNTKENIKTGLGLVHFFFGAVGAYNAVKGITGKTPIITEDRSQQSPLMRTTAKIATICSKSSNMLFGAVSWPSCMIATNVAGLAVSAERLEKMVGINSTFAASPLHPYNALSFAALALSVPSMVLTVGETVKWGYNKFYKIDSDKISTRSGSSWLTDGKIRAINFFEVVTNGKALAFLNNLAKRITGLL